MLLRGTIKNSQPDRGFAFLSVLGYPDHFIHIKGHKPVTITVGAVTMVISPDEQDVVLSDGDVVIFEPQHLPDKAQPQAKAWIYPEEAERQALRTIHQLTGEVLKLIG